MDTNNLTSALGLLAEKLGVAVSEIYNVMIAQARVSIIISNCVTAWMNPQFYALDYILDAIS